VTCWRWRAAGIRRLNEEQRTVLPANFLGRKR